MPFGLVFFDLVGLINNSRNLIAIDFAVWVLLSELNDNFKHFTVKASKPNIWGLKTLCTVILIVREDPCGIFISTGFQIAKTPKVLTDFAFYKFELLWREVPMACIGFPASRLVDFGLALKRDFFNDVEDSRSLQIFFVLVKKEFEQVD